MQVRDGRDRAYRRQTRHRAFHGILHVVVDAFALVEAAELPPCGNGEDESSRAEPRDNAGFIGNEVFHEPVGTSGDALVRARRAEEHRGLAVGEEGTPQGLALKVYGVPELRRALPDAEVRGRYERLHGTKGHGGGVDEYGVRGHGAEPSGYVPDVLRERREYRVVVEHAGVRIAEFLEPREGLIERAVNVAGVRYAADQDVRLRFKVVGRVMHAIPAPGVRRSIEDDMHWERRLGTLEGPQRTDHFVSAGADEDHAYVNAHANCSFTVGRMYGVNISP